MFFNYFSLTATSERVLLIPVVIIVFTILVVLMVLVVLIMLVMFVVLMVLVMFVVLVMLVVLARLVMLMVLAGLARLVYDNHSFRIPGVDVVHIGVAAPAYRLIEVVSLAVASPLAVAHHSAQLLVAVLPRLAVYVAIAVDGIEIAEVELQNAVALYVRESEFENHLVGYETCLSPYVGESLCAC